MKYKKGEDLKKPVIRRALFLGILMLIAAMLLVGCSRKRGTFDEEESQNVPNEPEKQFVIFENGSYTCDFIFPELLTPELANLRNELRTAMKGQFGINPAFKSDRKGSGENVNEFLLGETNRKQSDLHEAYDKNDAYFLIAVKDGKLILSGSDTYQIGLAVNFFVENYVKKASADYFAVPESIHEEKVMKDFTREKWTLYRIPAYAGGSRISYSYDTGNTLRDIEKSVSASQMVLVSKTNAAEFAAYTEKLVRFGYEKKYENRIEKNQYVSYSNGEQQVWVSFSETTQSARVIAEPVGITPEEFGYSYTPKAGERSEFYQYGIPMDSGNGEHINCGMSYVVRCADNSVIIIDGGGGEIQMNAEARAGFDVFLHSITGVPQGEKIRISAWFLTHLHSDHCIGTLNFLNDYGQNYTLERLIANIPMRGIWSDLDVCYSTYLKQISDYLSVHAPDCIEWKAHAGQRIQIADITMEVLFTHESLIDADSGKFRSGDPNDTCTVIRLDNTKMSMLIVGDANTPTERVLTSEFTEQTLKCDILQAAHHNIYYLESLYRKVKPVYVLIPQNQQLMEKTDTAVSGHPTWHQIYENVKALVDGENFVYCGGNETVGLTYDEAEEKIVVCYHSTDIPGK